MEMEGDRETKEIAAVVKGGVSRFSGR